MEEFNSYTIGRLFEEASQEILKLLFKEWGYKSEVLNSKRQNSGTQFGFDIYFKLVKDGSLPINIFVECKASKKFTKINIDEIIKKSNQLNDLIVKKDIHLFFSPTVSVNYTNNILSFENNNFPFCIIDMMRNGNSDILSLFLSYKGKNRKINDYKEKILYQLIGEKDISKKESFKKICEDLKEKFDYRINSFLSSKSNNDFTFLSPIFWNQKKQNLDEQKISDFYLRTNSIKNNIEQVVANDSYVINEAMTSIFDESFEKIKKNEQRLIKILSKGGEGKTTFLFHLGKVLSNNHPVFFIDNIYSNTFEKIREDLKLTSHNNIPVILIDDFYKYDSQITLLNFEIHKFQAGIIFIIAERNYRYDNMSNKDEFENNFLGDSIYYLNFSSRENLASIFEIFFSEFYKKYSGEFTKNGIHYESIKDNGKIVFCEKKNLCIAERIYKLIKFYVEKHNITYKFDWDEWEVVHKNSPLKNLYKLVSAFYQFGNLLDLKLCEDFRDFRNINYSDIRDATDESQNQPIIREGDKLRLRHEKLAEWYIKEKKQIDNVKAFYEELLTNIDTEEKKDLLLYTYRNKDFKNCEYLKNLLPPEKVIDLLKKYIAKYDVEEIKARNELGRIYYTLERWEDAIDVLNKIIEIDKYDKHSRIELGKIYIENQNWGQAIEILKELIDLDIDNNFLHAHYELAIAYLGLDDKKEEAENTLRNVIELDKENKLKFTRFELGKLLVELKKWNEAKSILEDAVKLDKEKKLIHARLLLGKCYIELEEWVNAEKILNEAKTLDNLNAIKNLKNFQFLINTEMKKIYQKREDLNSIESIFEENFKNDPKNKPVALELAIAKSKIGKIDEAVDLLKNIIDNDVLNIHARTKLAEIYYSVQENIVNSENLLREVLKIEPNNRIALKLLVKIYNKTENPQKMEEIYLDIFKYYPEDTDNQVSIAKKCRKFLKYHLSYDFFNNAFFVSQNESLYLLCYLLEICRDMGNQNLFLRLKEKGNQIKNENKNRKQITRFENINYDKYEEFIMDKFREVGVYKNNYVISILDEKIELNSTNLVKNNKISYNDKIYFSIFHDKKNETKKIANFLEPYYDSIENLKSLK